MTAKKRVHIVGFAPSWTETPWHDLEAERWGLNSLHRVAQGRPFDRWFQLHNLGVHHGGDFEHIQWLRQTPIPVYMWKHDMVGWDIPNAVPYPRDEIIEFFQPYPYFTNSISWMIALAIYEGFEEIGVYGVDMSQTSEYRDQRPSCEYFVGWARGLGIKIHIPNTADLLKSTHLYGFENADPYIDKLEARKMHLAQQKAQHEQQAQAHRDAALQLQGAMDDVSWVRTTWVPPRSGPDPTQKNLPLEPQEGPDDGD